MHVADSSPKEVEAGTINIEVKGRKWMQVIKEYFGNGGSNGAV